MALTVAKNECFVMITHTHTHTERDLQTCRDTHSDRVFLSSLMLMTFTLSLSRVPVLPPPHAHASTLCAADPQRSRHGLEDEHAPGVWYKANRTFR